MIKIKKGRWLIILAIIKDIKILINNEKKVVEVRCQSLKEVEKINDNIKDLKSKYPDYGFFINLDNKYKIDNLDINDLDKFKNHINQRLKLLIQIKELEEKKTKTYKYFYTIVASLPAKRKYIKCTIFNITPLQLSVGKYYIADGKLELGDPKFIKKNGKLSKNLVILIEEVLSLELIMQIFQVLSYQHHHIFLKPHLVCFLGTNMMLGWHQQRMLLYHIQIIVQVQIINNNIDLSYR